MSVHDRDKTGKTRIPLFGDPQERQLFKIAGSSTCATSKA